MPKDYNSTYKVGEYEFLAEVHYIPLFIIVKLVRVTIQLTHPRAIADSWKRSTIVRHSESGKMIQVLISGYLEGANFFHLP